MDILFINGSPNPNGNTAALAQELLKGKEYETLNLTDYRINCYGQELEGRGYFQDESGADHHSGVSAVLA